MLTENTYKQVLRAKLLLGPTPNLFPRERRKRLEWRWVHFSHNQRGERGGEGSRGEGARADGEPDRRRGCVSPVASIHRGMQTSDGWCKSCVVWAMWMLYVCFAMALTLGRSDGPSGQGFSSLRVESLLSKMTLEDKVGSFDPGLRSYSSTAHGQLGSRLSCSTFRTKIHPIFRLLLRHCRIIS